eukprot:XP_001689626.1 predicted protein [Chlamydomonas reinhardtii]
MGTGGAGGRTRNTAGLLSLSAMHAGLGHTSEALQALNEAMRLAQQAGDGAALLQLLRMLRRCGERGRELRQPALVAFAALATARFALQVATAVRDTLALATAASLRQWTCSRAAPTQLSDGQQLQELLVLLQDALPLILAHGSSLLQARAQLTLAEMVMSSPPRLQRTSGWKCWSC